MHIGVDSLCGIPEVCYA